MIVPILQLLNETEAQRNRAICPELTLSQQQIESQGRDVWSGLVNILSQGQVLLAPYGLRGLRFVQRPPRYWRPALQVLISSKWTF